MRSVRPASSDRRSAKDGRCWSIPRVREDGGDAATWIPAFAEMTAIMPSALDPAFGGNDGSLHMTPNERVEPADPIADGLRRCRVAEANVLPVVGYTTTEVNIGQYRYARFRQQTLAE